MEGNRIIKKLFAALMCIMLFLPLYAQEKGKNATGQAEGEYYDPYYHPNFQSYYQQDDKTDPQKSDKPGDVPAAEDEPTEEELASTRQKKTGFGRNYFEIGIDAGIGFDNDLFRQSDIFREKLVIDLERIGGDIGRDGLNLNLDVLAGLFVNIKNINIKEGTWDFGFSLKVDDGINFNVPESLLTLLSDGNAKHRSVKGTISASGGIFADTGIGVSAAYGNLSLGARPALFAPLVFIPKTGIKYSLESEEYISLKTSGDIQIYSVLNKDGEIVIPGFGFDLSLEGEYALFSFLDVGGSLSNIPLVSAVMHNRMLFYIDDFNFDIKGEDLLAGEDLDLPEFDFTTSHEPADFKVFRPLRFDAYALWRPLGGFLIVKPNLGVSVSIIDKQWYFNAGAEARINLLKNLFSAHLGTGIEELVWKHRLGFALNLSAFELDLEAVLRSQNFIRSFGVQGVGVNLGLRFGW